MKILRAYVKNQEAFTTKTNNFKIFKDVNSSDIQILFDYSIHTNGAKKFYLYKNYMAL